MINIRGCVFSGSYYWFFPFWKIHLKKGSKPSDTMIWLDIHGQRCALRVLWPWREHEEQRFFFTRQCPAGSSLHHPYESLTSESTWKAPPQLAAVRIFGGKMQSLHSPYIHHSVILLHHPCARASRVKSLLTFNCMYPKRNEKNCRRYHQLRLMRY